MAIKTRNVATHNTCYGKIYPSDFDTEYPASHNIASRLITDWDFDIECQKNRAKINFLKENANGSNKNRIRNFNRY